MSEANVSIVLTVGADAAELAANVMRSQGTEVQTSPIHNLDGAAVPAWILIATTATQSAPLLMNSMREFPERKALSSPDDVEVATADVPKCDAPVHRCIGATLQL